MSISTVSTRLRVLMFTDIVGSMDLKTRFGSLAYMTMIARHDDLLSRVMAAEAGAEMVKDTGDGCFASFPTASAAARTALRFQQAIRVEPWRPEPLLVRIGIHLGEMGEIQREAGGETKLVGLAVDMAARVASLAGGGQILLTRDVFNEARQFVEAYPTFVSTGSTSSIAADANPSPALKWVAHGPYLIKGVEEPVEIFEIGGEGMALLSPPPSSDKAKRVVPHDLEETLGWRPAVGLEIPQRPGWILDKKLGEGGFGEVWLGVQKKLREKRVFKFCFDPERLRSFKREMTLFRLLRDALGDRKDIVRLYEVKLDEAPFFLESEYTDGGNLCDWAAAKGGIGKVPLQARLDLIAEIADAVAAAHSVGVLHKDIKPSNILIYEENGKAHPRLSDFGIGMLSDRHQLQARNITETGFTAITQNDSSRTGTRMYAPPELLANRPFTVQGDVYALGVLLYQMAVGDLERPIGMGWERDVPDEMLREEIAACCDADPQRRLAIAGELAERIRSLPKRRGRTRWRRLRQKGLRKFEFRGAAISALICLLVFGICAGMRHVGALQQLELYAYDWILRLHRPTSAPSAKFLIIQIDESDILSFHQYPMSDNAQANLLQRLEKLNPSVIGMDIFGDVPAPELGNKNDQGPQLLEKVFVANRNIICPMEVSERGVLPPKVFLHQLIPGNRIPSQIGFTDVRTDDDGVVRRLDLRQWDNRLNLPVLSLNLLVALTYLRSAEPQIKLKLGENDIRIGAADLQGIVPSDGAYLGEPPQAFEQYLDSRRYIDFPTISFQQAVDPDHPLTENDVKDAIVLVGVHADSVPNALPTSLSPAEPDIRIHARMIDQLIREAHGERPISAWPTTHLNIPFTGKTADISLRQLAWWLVWALLGGAFGFALRSPLTLVAINVLCAAALFGATWLEMRQGVWIPLVPPMLCCFGCAAAVAYYMSMRGTPTGRTRLPLIAAKLNALQN
jgi:CHASE2 domain-containing sensor protein/class 3 adenylate cyclase